MKEQSRPRLTPPQITEREEGLGAPAGAVTTTAPGFSAGCMCRSEGPLGTLPPHRQGMGLAIGTPAAFP